jgi:hypothetical protein
MAVVHDHDDTIVVVPQLTLGFPRVCSEIDFQNFIRLGARLNGQKILGSVARFSAGPGRKPVGFVPATVDIGSRGPCLIPAVRLVCAQGWRGGCARNYKIPAACLSPEESMSRAGWY